MKCRREKLNKNRKVTNGLAVRQESAMLAWIHIVPIILSTGIEM